MMATAADLRRLAMSLDGVEEKPHFDRAAFRARKIFVTLAADGLTANFAFSPDEQALKCTILPKVFAPLPNTWGQRGWTVGTLARMSKEDLAAALETAWRHAVAPPLKRKPRKA